MPRKPDSPDPDVYKPPKKERSAMLKHVVSILEDGGWHPFLEIANHAQIPEETVLDAVRFLSKFDLGRD